MPRGVHPASLANLRKGSVSTKKRPPKPKTNAPAHMQMMNEARARKRTIEREFPIKTSRPVAVEEVPAVAPEVETPRPTESEEHVGVVHEETETPTTPPIVEPASVEESEGDRRARLYERDHALVRAGNWRELNRLKVSESSTFPRVQGHGRIDWAALGSM